MAFVRTNLGNTLLRTGHTDEAILELQEAVASDPEGSLSHYFLAGAYATKGWSDEALAEYLRVTEIEPGHALAHAEVANLLLKAGRTQEAIERFRKALSLNSSLAVAHANLGYALLETGEWMESITHSRRSLEIDPHGVAALQNLGLAYARSGCFREASVAFAETLRIDPSIVSALTNGAWILATSPEADLRDGPLALEYALRADQQTGGVDLWALRVLAAAYAEVCQFENAEQTVQRALALVAANSNTPASGTLRADLQAYRAGRPLRIPAPPQ